MTIHIYPVLCSQTVNPNIITGIAKSIEKYILVNRLDEIMSFSRKHYYVDRTGRINVESYNLLEMGISTLSSDIDELKRIKKEIEDKYEPLVTAASNVGDLPKVLALIKQANDEIAAADRDFYIKQKSGPAPQSGQQASTQQASTQQPGNQNQKSSRQSLPKRDDVEIIVKVNDMFRDTYVLDKNGNVRLDDEGNPIRTDLKAAEIKAKGAIDNYFKQKDEEFKRYETGYKHKLEKQMQGGDQEFKERQEELKRRFERAAKNKELEFRKKQEEEKLKWEKNKFNAQVSLDANKTLDERGWKERQERERREFERDLEDTRNRFKTDMERDKRVYDQSQEIWKNSIKNASDAEKRKHEEDMIRLKNALDLEKIKAQAVERAAEKEAERKQGEERAAPARVDIGRIESESLALEPTWIKIDTPEGPALIGIKVVPFPVKSDAKLTELLLKDRYRSSIEKKLISMSRTIHRWLFKVLYDKLRGLSVFSRSTLTQEPMHDIIYDRSRFSKTGVFALVNRADLDDNFFKSAGGLNSLFKLGWNTIIIADEVNKQIYFVAKEFKGSYSIVPYPFLYTGVNRDASKVYTDLQDVRKSSGPLFKMRGNIMKLLGEGLSDQKLKQYRTTILEDRSITILRESMEGISEAGEFIHSLKKMKGDQLKSKIESIEKFAKMGDIDAIKSTLKFVPKSVGKLSIIEKYSKKLMGDKFVKYYSLSQKVISNSLPDNHPPDAIKIISCLCALTGFKKENPDKEVRNSIKIAVGKIRKYSIVGKKPLDLELVTAYIMASCALIAIIIPLSAVVYITLILAGSGSIFDLSGPQLFATAIIFMVAVIALMWTIQWKPDSRDETPSRL